VLRTPARLTAGVRLKFPIEALMHTFIKMALIAACTSCAACVPFPHYEQISPEISGLVTRDKNPLPSVKILLAQGMNSADCPHAAETVETNSKGIFNIPRRTRFRWFYRPLVMPIAITTYTVCLSIDEKTYLGHQGFVQLTSSSSVALNCDLNTPFASNNSLDQEMSLVCK
jgi:hypothetical protein